MADSRGRRASGPGVISRDGSPVEFYRRFPAGQTLERIAAELPPAVSVLDLGCGTGRIADALADLGHPVTAVDQEPAMLAQVRHATTVRADIETLDLSPQRFDAVLLVSNLINTADDAARAAMLNTCRRHVAEDGVVVLGHLDAQWAIGAREGLLSDADGIRISIRDIRRSPGGFSAVMVYEADGQTWTQPFDNRVLDDNELAAALVDAGLRWSHRPHPTLLVAKREL